MTAPQADREAQQPSADVNNRAPRPHLRHPMESAALSREEREPLQECRGPLNLGTSSLKTARDGRGNQLASSAPPRTTSRPGRAACPKGLNTSERANLNLPWRSVSQFSGMASARPSAALHASVVRRFCVRREAPMTTDLCLPRSPVLRRFSNARAFVSVSAPGAAVPRAPTPKTCPGTDRCA